MVCCDLPLNYFKKKNRIPVVLSWLGLAWFLASSNGDSRIKGTDRRPALEKILQLLKIRKYQEEREKKKNYRSWFMITNHKK